LNQIGARPLYKAYHEWTEEAGELPVSETTFAARMSQRSEFEKKESRVGAIYTGLKLKPFEVPF
jgi:phage/plasmid-associated DNA primase